VQDMSLLVFKDDKGYSRLEGNDPNNQMRIDMTEEEIDAWIEQHSHRYVMVNLEEALHIIKNTRVKSQGLHSPLSYLLHIWVRGMIPCLSSVHAPKHVNKPSSRK
jgi:hypothetical protein